MVTFVCEYCDTTLKKKQVDGHIRGRCSPGAMICIDCSGTFYGNDHKAHVTCISEQDKHWGQYAKSQKTKPIAKAPKQQQPTSNGHRQEPKPQQNTKNQVMQQQCQIEQKCEELEWKGWKNQIKLILGESEGPLPGSKLKKKLQKVYRKKVKQPLNDEEFQTIFTEKVEKIKGINKQTYYSLA